MSPANSLLFTCLIIVLSSGLLDYSVDGKPTDGVGVVTSKSFQPSQSIPPQSSGSAGRKVLTSWNEDGSWQASARLPTSSQTGGNDRSRYKIRRDGSLSLALQIPKPQSLFSHNFHQGSLGGEPSAASMTSNWARDSSIPSITQIGQRASGTTRQFSPAELRSFSVVISDVDVTGNYNNNNDKSNQDSYSKAGVASYHLKSNSIHRMNASWKLKPGHSAPTSSDLLEFLSYFANGDRATRSEQLEQQEQQEPHQQQFQKPLRKILGQYEVEGGDDDEAEVNKENKQPFLTWSESSRKIPLTSEVVDNSNSSSLDISTISPSGDANQQQDSEVATSNVSASLNYPSSSPNPIDEVEDATTTDIQYEENTSTRRNEAKVVLHELISTLEKLNENVDEEEKEKTSVDIEKSSANQRKNASSILHEAVDTASQPQPQQNQTELDQTTTTESESKQEHEQQVDLEMTESLQKEEEKKVDAFAKDDAAKFASYTNTTHNSTSHDDDHQHEYMVEEDGKRNARSAFFESKTKSTKSTNRNGRNNNNATSTSTTSLDSVNSQQRMKITDPQQTASDLKKLMSLILKSDGNRNGGGGGGGVRGDANKSGTQVVNIVITPNQDAFSSSSSAAPQSKNNPQKILFLKTPQVKQMLDIALSDPAVSSAAHKIAAALESNPFPNPIPTHIDHTYNSLPSFIINHNENNNNNNNDMQHASNTNEPSQSDTSNNDNSVPSTPDGFPLTGTGFLNLHHPNLQFHQALHHLIVNGTAPTSINATTKTNVINIFVINFKENDHHETGGYPPGISPINQSPLRINIKPKHAQRPKPPFPIDINPILIESVSPTPDPALFFHSKMGLAEAVSAATDTHIYDFDDNITNESPGMLPEKYYEPSRSTLISTGRPQSDKINIFDLLPGDIGTATAVQYAPGVERGEKDQTHNQTMPSTVGMLNLDSKLSTVKPATVPFTDYFADFLPDHSRDPGNERPQQPQESENLSEHDILSILTSSRKPVTSTTSTFATAEPTFTSLPPSLAHLEWIFKNQPPPKPQIPQNTLLKRKGTTASGEMGSNEEAEGGSSDSMMEPDETSNAPFHGGTTQELVEYLLKLQNVTKSTDFNLLESNYTTIPSKTPMQNSNSTQNITKTPEDVTHSEVHQVIEYTTKPPAFWKFGNKIPLGGFSNAEEAINNRLRKVLTAFGYSALPTLAAGAAATWPYWVPLVAAGRRRRRSSPYSKDEKFSEVVFRNSSPLSKLATLAIAESSSSSLGKNGTTTLPILRSSNRQLLSKSTKNNRRDGVGEQKWIKVDVITTSNPFLASSSSPSSLISTSSPTLLRFEMNSHPQHHNQHHPTENGTSFHSQSYNGLRTKNNNNNSNNRFNIEDYNVENSSQKQSQSQQQLDLPLLKNFLKNVLYNEFSMSTSAPPLLLTPSSPIPMKAAQKPNHEHHYIHHPATFPLSSAASSPSSSSSSSSGPVALSQYPIFTTNLNKIQNGHPFNGGITTQTQSSNNSPVLLNTFSRPSSSSFPEKQYNNNGDEQMIAGSDKKVISISAFSTPSPTSVYIHNRGDGTTSTTSTIASSSSSSTASPSLLQLQRNPWGSSFGRPDKVSSTVTTTFTNTPHGAHSAQTQIFNGANNIDYHVDHYHQHANKGKQKMKLAEAIRAAEKSYASAALFPLWFPILFGSQSQVSSKLKEVIKRQHLKGY